MLVIIFEYYNKESGAYETDQIEIVEYQDFKNYISDNDIINYEILDIIVE